MRHSLLLAAVMAVMTALGSAAHGNRVYIQDFEIEPGTCDTVPVMLANIDPSRGLQFNISLPEGLEYVDCLATEYSLECTMTVSCNYSRKESCYVVYIYPTQRVCYSPGNAAIAYMVFEADPEFKGGTLTTWKCRGATLENETIFMDGNSTTVTVPQASIIELEEENAAPDRYFNLMGQPIDSPAGAPVAIQVTTLPDGECQARKVCKGH